MMIATAAPMRRRRTATSAPMVIAVRKPVAIGGRPRITSPRMRDSVAAACTVTPGSGAWPDDVGVSTRSPMAMAIGPTKTSFPRKRGASAASRRRSTALIVGILRGRVRNAGASERPTGTGAPVMSDDASTESAISERSSLCFVAENRRTMPSWSISKLPCTGVIAFARAGTGRCHCPCSSSAETARVGRRRAAAASCSSPGRASARRMSRTTPRAPASAARLTIVARMARSHGHGPIARNDGSSMATIVVVVAARGGRSRRARSRTGSSSASTALNAASSVTAIPLAIARNSAVRPRSMDRMVRRASSLRRRAPPRKARPIGQPKAGAPPSSAAGPASRRRDYLSSSASCARRSFPNAERGIASTR